MWKDRDEAMNFTQKHDIEIIKDEKRYVPLVADSGPALAHTQPPSPPPHTTPLPLTHTLFSHVRTATCTFLLISPSCRSELESEVRLQVDDLMREELKNLKLVCPTSRSAFLQS